jgi:hypothetical protein
MFPVKEWIKHLWPSLWPQGPECIDSTPDFLCPVQREIEDEINDFFLRIEEGLLPAPLNWTREAQDAVTE